MTDSIEKRLLWVDDDGPARYPYEISYLNDYGWDVDWAEAGGEAADKLHTTRYQILLLDQVFPFAKGSANKDVWGGCRLLYWLRKQEIPEDVPNDAHWEGLQLREPPALENQSIPVLILSAFYNDDVTKAIHDIDEDVPIMEKPIDEEYLIGEIEKRSKGASHDT